VLPDTSSGQHQVAEVYSKKWRMMPTYGYSEATLAFQRKWYLQKFGWRTTSNFKRYLWAKKHILDAGCGLGRDVKFYAENTSGLVFGVDISDSIIVAQEKLGQLPNVHLIKADMMRLPFPVGFFDFVACDQALHHTGNTHDGFMQLAHYVKPHGQMAIYVYKKKSEAREYADDLIRKYTTDMDYGDCMVFATACTMFGKIVSDLNLELQRDIYWNIFKCFWDGKYDFKTNVLINLDWYHPKYAWRHTPEQVKEWCQEAKIDVHHFDVCESGISVRGYKS
jgi:SAM-dependent methyltransferase